MIYETFHVETCTPKQTALGFVWDQPKPARSRLLRAVFGQNVVVHGLSFPSGSFCLTALIWEQGGFQKSWNRWRSGADLCCGGKDASRDGAARTADARTKFCKTVAYIVDVNTCAWLVCSTLNFLTDGGIPAQTTRFVWVRQATRKPFQSLWCSVVVSCDCACVMFVCRRGELPSSLFVTLFASQMELILVSAT